MNLVFLGLLAAASGACAQEAASPKGVESAANNQSGSYEILLRDAKTLIERGKPDKAYQLLAPLEFRHAGDVRFDYLIGIAALDSGQPDKATLAFERVLAMDPGSAAARLDMARAYYQLGDLPRARTEFFAALKQNPSATARANIQKYLDAIDAQGNGNRMRYSAYVEAGLGRDSNLNYATSQSHVFVDSAMTTVALGPSNTKTSDNYLAAATGGEVSQGLGVNWGLYAGADVRKRANGTHTDFDSLNTSWRVGISYEAQADRLRASLAGSRYELGGASHNNTSGYKVEWRHVFSPANQLNAFFHSVQYRYAEPLLQANDIDQQAYGIGWLHVLADGQSSLSGNIYQGRENDVAPIIIVNDPIHGNITANPSSGRNDGARRFSGWRIGTQKSVSGSTALFAGAGMQTGDYDKTNYLFLRTRQDRFYDLNVGADWRWEKFWTLRPQLSYSRNDSNIAIYDYDRMDVSLSVRRDFR
ncbi:MAG TPA: tetratricopeptide repeat protein [Gallionella sp.]